MAPLLSQFSIAVSLIVWTVAEIAEYLVTSVAVLFRAPDHRWDALHGRRKGDGCCWALREEARSVWTVYSYKLSWWWTVTASIIRVMNCHLSLFLVTNCHYINHPSGELSPYHSTLWWTVTISIILVTNCHYINHPCGELSPYNHSCDELTPYKSSIFVRNCHHRIIHVMNCHHIIILVVN